MVCCRDLTPKADHSSLVNSPIAFPAASAIDPPRAVRGMRDRFGLDMRKYRHVCQTGSEVAELYDFDQISTPVLEYASVFERTLGDESDIVGKELYTFTDKSDSRITMRPEGTAGIARALITNNLTRALPQKFYYYGPMFRHERPQKGRFRQFEQFGVELFGYNHPSSDVEVIDMAWTFLQRLGLGGVVKLEINSLGDQDTRKRYKALLTEFLMDNVMGLSEDSTRRLRTNPLRVLDSKNPLDQDSIARAPLLTTHLTPFSRSRFDNVLAGLDACAIPYVVNPRLVRGLDYYEETVFEFVYSGKEEELGAQQATVLAGGRYDKLVEVMSGKRESASGVGWAAGVDRLALLLPPALVPEPIPAITIVVVPSDDPILLPRLVNIALRVASRLRREHGLPTVVRYFEPERSQRLDRIVKRVADGGGKFMGFVNKDVMERGEGEWISIKNLKNHRQEVMRVEEVAKWINRSGGDSGDDGGIIGGGGGD
ncbi:hypothetical protein BC937DRAFT_95127 [Endogone sp. FLAS-F59071]|nr:hypothetical protein BC937DRAFT_95127 [Endogone sp. FLAS-F59071]|eukprot:RUS20471.1 hypothetical protein BC937DRAFT_95127 [Endogone sp. FLAS-F59071]